MEASAPKRGKAGNGLGQREEAVERSSKEDEVSRVDTTIDQGPNGTGSVTLEDRMLRLDAGRRLECIERIAARQHPVTIGR